MRWSIVPLLFGLAGAAGGALDALLSGAVMGKYGDTADICAYVGGGIGLGIGVAMCVSRKAWIGVVSSPLLGITGYFVLVTVMNLIAGEKLPQWKEVLGDDFALSLAAPAALVLVAAHHLYLRLLKLGVSPLVGLATYSVLGALSGSWFWVRHGDLAAGLLDGALYGLAQHVAMLCARGVEKWRAQPGA